MRRQILTAFTTVLFVCVVWSAGTAQDQRRQVRDVEVNPSTCAQTIIYKNTVTNTLWGRNSSSGLCAQLGPSGPGSTVPATVQGDLLFASAANTLSALAKSATPNSFLKNSGTSNNPAWSTIASTDISDSTTVGRNVLSATNPSAISFPKVAADNTVSFRTPAQVLGDIGAQAGPLTGDVTTSGAASTLATVNGNVGSFGSATQSLTLTANGKGLITAISAQTVTPAVGSVTGLGTSVGTALAVNVGTAGAFVVNGGAGGTPSSIILTNGTGLPTTGLTGTLQAAQEPAHTGDVTNSAGSLALSIAANAVTLAKLATQATNTVLGNATSGTAVPTALAVGTCSTPGSALIWTTNTGFGCNTSITASTASTATTLTGTWTGTATNDSAAAGKVGEIISSAVDFGSAISLTTNTDTNITSISLTAGDWDVSVWNNFLPAASTTVVAIGNSISTTSATTNSATGGFTSLRYPAGTVLGAIDATVTIGPVRLSLASTTTVFLVVKAQFATSTMTAYGKIVARRMR